jgi:hypothetical protein
MSTCSAEGDDEKQAPGFIFFQLGELQCVPHHYEQSWSATLAEGLATTIDDHDWEKTGFNLVARLGGFRAY